MLLLDYMGYQYGMPLFKWSSRDAHPLLLQGKFA